MLGFAEAGNNYDSFIDYRPFELKRSAGVGLRIFMPMFGLLGVGHRVMALTTCLTKLAPQAGKHILSSGNNSDHHETLPSSVDFHPPLSGFQPAIGLCGQPADLGSCA